ncbi:MAG: 3-hydroxybutyryl-CoA dehydrogenase [Deltaproteobacteria bacterium]|nr:3-hydroxybutyryl-CoA dehydrogenase [Deltaproteobacteria bacterium]
MSVEKIGVLGCGLMGAGIAQVCAQSGLQTVVREIDQKFIDNGFCIIEKNVQKAVEKVKISKEDKDAMWSKIQGTLELDDMKECDLIIEAVVENLELKNEMFSTLDKICPEKTILASNTSSLTIMAMAASTNRPDRFCGLHFFNPVPVMQLVEVVKTIATRQQTTDTCFEFCKRIGKTPILAKDNSGFIVNRLLIPYLLDAIKVFEEGLASTEDIDTGMKLGLNYPMGPLTLLDFVGLDTTYNIANIMFEEFREQRFAPPPLLKKMVLAGYYGRKSGKGFYDYSGDKPMPSDLGI